MRHTIVITAFVLSCSSSTSSGPSEPGAPAEPSSIDTATTHDWTPRDGERLITDFVRQCFVESRWADDFAAARGRQPTVRVAQIEAQVEDVNVLTEAFSGQIEKALLDSKKVQVAASIQDLVEVQNMQSVRLLSNSGNNQEQTGTDLSSDLVLTVRVTSVAEPATDGVLRVYSAAFRMVNTETGAMECVAMGQSKKLVPQQD